MKRKQKYVKDLVLLKQKKLSVLDITGFFFRMSTQVKAEVSMQKKEIRSIQLRAASFVSIVTYLTIFLPPNTTELLKTTTERIKTITEHLKVTTEHIFFITIREFLISCWETKFYHKTSKNGRRTLLFYHNVHPIFTELILTAEHFLLQPIDLIFMQKNNHLRKAYY